MPSYAAKDKNRHEIFSRRAFLLSSGMTAVFAVLAGRLYQLQIVDGERYLDQAEANRISERLLAPPRGRILDRFGVELAGNRRNYRVLIVPEQTRDGVPAALAGLNAAMPLDGQVQARVLKEAVGAKPFTPIVVMENISWDDFARLNLELPYLAGVQPDTGQTRDYPYAEELSHVLGYVAAVSPQDKLAAQKSNLDPNRESPDRLLDVPGLRIGKRGVEMAFDTQIRGHGGVSRVEVNAYGRELRELDRAEGRPGGDLYLTIDRELQHLIHSRLKDDSAAAVVMDVENGDVLALVSTPGFDPNAFNVGVTPGQWRDMLQNERKPLINKALSGIYPPGSTFKTITALAALEAGAIDPDTPFHCAGYYTLGGHAFHCWKRGGHGLVDLRQGIKVSCDCFFYQVAMKVGIDAIADCARRLGLGRTTGIEIPGEHSGLIPDRAWKKERFKQAWQQGETLVAGIGQGYVTATPLQLCTMAARLAGGRAVSPRIVHSLGAARQVRPAVEELGFSSASLQAVREGMIGAANEPGGTAYSWRITDPVLAMAGKTGTAQVRVISAAEHLTGVRSNESLPWRLRDHGLYVAYAPLDRPRYACAVIIEHGSVAAHTQVQVARDALILAQKRDLAGRPTAYPMTAASAAP